MKLFGSSGIRGLVNKDVDAKLAMAVGNSVGSLYGNIVLGHDTRASYAMLSSALTAGALLSGSRVSDAGLVPTPTLACSTKKFDCGIMVTASHNPPDYNGIKLWNPDGSSFDTAQMENVESAVLAQKLKKVGWRELRPVERHGTALREHTEKILASVERANLKVVVDCLNGATSVVTPYVLMRMGCDVITLNADPDGSFHGRTPEPTEENLEDLKSMVRGAKAHLGIAHDGDGDRVVAVDERGRYVDGDRLLALFSSVEAVKNIVIPFDSSMAIEDHLRHVTVHRCRVGDVFVSETIKRTGSDFGGEPSGTFIFPKFSMGPDGIFAAAKLVELVKKDPLSRHMARLPSYPVMKTSVSFQGSKKEKVMREVMESVEAIRSQGLEKMDGIKLIFENSWALVRFSGTEPKVRITVEARTKGAAKTTFQKVSSAVKRAVGKAR